RSIQARLADPLHQQHGPGLRDHSTTAALDADTRVRPDKLLHLTTASYHGAIRTREKPYRSTSRALLAFVIKPRTVHLMKARGLAWRLSSADERGLELA